MGDPRFVIAVASHWRAKKAIKNRLTQWENRDLHSRF